MNVHLSTLLVVLAGCSRLAAPSGSAEPGADLGTHELAAQATGADGEAVPTSLTSLVCLETELCANGRDDDMDGSTDEDCGPCDAYATRGLHWWRGHECVISGEATGYELYPVTIGDGAVTLADADAVSDFLFAPNTGDQRALSLAIVVAKLNIAAFGIGDTPFADYDGNGDLETVQEIVDEADRVWTEGTSDSEYFAMITLLSRMNGQGLDTPAWFDEECSGDIEVCNGVDDDADGSTDEGCLCLEECDGYDNDFDGTADDGYADTDRDGTADCMDVESCDGLDNDGDGTTDEGFDSDLDLVADCFDAEECDGLDNNGDGWVDEGFDADFDSLADCFDVEECDGLDNDGDGTADDGFDNDGDGLANCFDVETCDGIDNNGDGQVDEGLDNDGDGLANCFDVETCDGIDNDGDGIIDNGWDDDGDGWAECMGDCVDTNPDVHPGVVDDDCDRMDDDCDGLIDEDMTISHSSGLPVGTPPRR